MPEPTTIAAAAALIRSGALTPSELLEQCLSRIDQFEERVRAWVHIDRAGARLQAVQLTDELKRNNSRGPLHGIPIGIKDIIDVFDMPTGCGSKLWAASYARRDAACVARLRDAGAIIVGKTVTTAYASFDPPPTRNPWHLDRTPGGSSSGSAAAVACGMCLGALGTQTGGSIVRPASYCGVYSLKPSHGRLSVDGVLPLAPSLDHVGVMANCVSDLALLLQPLADNTSHRPYHYPREQKEDGYDRPAQLSTLPQFPSTADPEMHSLFVALRAKTSGPRWVWNEHSLPPAFAAVPRHHQTMMAVEAAAYHAERMRRRPEEYPERVRGLIERGLSTSAADFVNVQSHYRTLRNEIEHTFVDSGHNLITPATTGAAPAAATTGDPSFNSPWSYVGLPTVSLPFAWSADGLPLSIQLIGNRWLEDHLLATAILLEEDIGFAPRPLPL
jgi:aspartyl-tRNA(Asn)/glutamyl-tRNA(Gln) amidotransferase subunit A